MYFCRSVLVKIDTRCVKIVGNVSTVWRREKANHRGSERSPDPHFLLVAGLAVRQKEHT
jgi:hypothetical protein